MKLQFSIMVLPLFLTGCALGCARPETEWVAKNADGSLKSAMATQMLHQRLAPKVQEIETQARQKFATQIQTECAKPFPFETTELFPVDNAEHWMVEHNTVDRKSFGKVLCRSDFTVNQKNIDDNWDIVHWICPECVAVHRSNTLHFVTPAVQDLYAESNLVLGERPRKRLDHCLF